MKPTSIRLTDRAEKALAWLRARVGGFNLNQAASQVIIAEAERQGWKEDD